MNDISALIVDADENTFGRDVIAASASHLVLVDFWAPWCGPCRSLTPILEKLVNEHGGAVRLVKVNTDEQQQLAASFGIRSLPTVFLFRDGEPVDQFMGVQPEPVIRRLIDRHLVRESDEQLARAETLHAGGDVDGAIDLLTKAVAADPANDRPKFVLAQWLADGQRFGEASEVLNGISPDGRSDPRYTALSAHADLGARPAAERSLDELRGAVARNADDLESRFQLADCLVRTGDLTGALEQLIEVIGRDRGFRDDEPRRTVLRIFDLLGGRGELVDRYRRQLARVLN